MRIQHNIMAMNAYRNYNTNNSALSKNLEKLSSGYKINRAGDDAAGLAISEKMRAQITGLDTAQKNAKDGISLVQTAEGALTEVHDMLNRMVELATQSSNGTYSNEVDRQNLQEEIVQLKSEINRIADSANFNGLKLLNGSMDAAGTAGGSDIEVSFGALSGVQAEQSSATPEFTVNLDGLSVKNTSTQAATLSITLDIGGKTITLKATGVAAGSEATAGNFELTASKTLTLGGLKYKVANGSTGDSLNFTLHDDSKGDLGKDGVTLNPSFKVEVTAIGAKGQQTGQIYNTATQVVTAGRPAKAEQVARAEFALTADMLKAGTKITIGNQTFTIDYTKKSSTATGTTIGVKDLLDENGNLGTDKLNDVASLITKQAANGAGNTYFNIGNDGSKLVITSKTALASASKEKIDTADELRKMISVTGATSQGSALVLQIGDTSDNFNQLSVSIKDTHTDSLGIDDIDISTQAGAKSAVDAIKSAINTVSSVRGTLGATQNRLDHTINNLSVMEENIQDAESTIRDTDVAEEMMSYTKNNILIQSAQAMLAQANQVPQGVLQLLG